VTTFRTFLSGGRVVGAHVKRGAVGLVGHSRSISLSNAEVSPAFLVSSVDGAGGHRGVEEAAQRTGLKSGLRVGAHIVAAAVLLVSQEDTARLSDAQVLPAGGVRIRKAGTLGIIEVASCVALLRVGRLLVADVELGTIATLGQIGSIHF